MTGVPTLSLTDFTHGDEAARASFSRAIMAALQRYGFFILTDHNVDLDLIDNA